MPGARSARDRRLKAVEYNFSKTGFCPPVNPELDKAPEKYFRPEPVSTIYIDSLFLILAIIIYNRCQDKYVHMTKGKNIELHPLLPIM